jgi:hypothetical protein
MLFSKEKERERKKELVVERAEGAFSLVLSHMI